LPSPEAADRAPAHVGAGRRLRFAVDVEDLVTVGEKEWYDDRIFESPHYTVDGDPAPPSRSWSAV
jgi:hypothetical protein